MSAGGIFHSWRLCSVSISSHPMSSYPPHFFSSPSSSSQSSSNTTPFMRNPYPTSYHPVHPPPIYYPFPPFDGSVNMNNPYIYDPTHVKHRRRTTPEQLKVLEETFKTDPKPNPALRKKLALELSMTPRVLQVHTASLFAAHYLLTSHINQVWFQNRLVDLSYKNHFLIDFWLGE